MRLTTKQVLKGFNITPMTLYNWRRGLNGRTPFPTHTEPRGTKHKVYFILEEVVAWAKANGLTFKPEFEFAVKRPISSSRDDVVRV